MSQTSEKANPVHKICIMFLRVEPKVDHEDR